MHNLKSLEIVQMLLNQKSNIGTRLFGLNVNLEGESMEFVTKLLMIILKLSCIVH